MPFKYTKTTSDILPWGRSVSFNTTSYISTPANAVFNPGNTGAWTLECWFYPRATTGGRIVINGNGGNWGHALQIFWGITAGGTSKFSFGQQNGSSGVVWQGTSASTYALNTWYHLAVSKDSNNDIKCFINGVEETALRQTNRTSTIASNNRLVVNSRFSNLGTGEGCNCFTSNVRWTKGTALYTASFTPSNSPLDVVTSTTLLACHDTSFKDGSVNNFAITTVGTPSISTVTPFAISTKSVLFNGSNQYLKLPSNSSAWTLNGDFTIECWFNTSTTNQNGIFTMNWNGDWNTVYGNGFSLNSNVVVTPQGNTTWTSPSINVWHHIAAVRSGSTITTYLDGVDVGSQTNSNQFGNASTTPGVGLFDTQSGVRAPFPGYISNLRILKGAALYTASFTALAEPLTSIASCSLLTCNAATIVDSSNNNFTITNNGSATVSSVVPFNAVGYGYKFKNVSSTAAKRNFNFSKSAVTLVYLTQKAIFGYGNNGATNYSITNLVSNTGVVATDTAGVGTARHGPAAAGYGSDKAIFGYGTAGAMTNLVSNTGVVAIDTTGVGTVRNYLAAAGYGSDKAIFGYGSGPTSLTNLVSNTGVVATDTAGVGTARSGLAAAGYGSNKAIFGYGSTGALVSITNLVSNTGVVATDTAGVGTARQGLAAAGYGTDKAIFGYGNSGAASAITNLVSNTGIVATDTTGVGTARFWIAAAGYGSDKSIFGYGQTGVALSITNLVSNTGVVATDTTGVGTVRNGLAAAGYSLT